MVQRAVRESAREKDIKDLGKDGERLVPADGVREPRFARQPGTGLHDHVLPGNKDLRGGRPHRAPAVGRRRQGLGRGRRRHGEGEDDFRFVLTREEFLDLFLDDLELPDLAKRRLSMVGDRRACAAPATRSPARRPTSR